MTNITKAAQDALEALDSLLDVAMVPMTCEGLCSADSAERWGDFSARRDALRAALQDKAGEAVVSLTGPERVWTCTVIGRAEDLPHGADAPMRQAVYQAFAKATGDAPAHIFSGWGAPVPERYRAVIDNRLPDPEVIRKECVEILDTLPAAQPAPVVPDGWRIEMAPQWSETRLRVMPPGEPHYLLLEPGSMNEAGGVLYALCRAMIAASQQKGGQ